MAFLEHKRLELCEHRSVSDFAEVNGCIRKRGGHIKFAAKSLDEAFEPVHRNAAVSLKP
jgi:hypothetical protein